MVSDQDIAAALESLVREASPNTTLNDVVQQLESKLGLDLTHKVDFIRAQIHFLLRSEPPHLPQPQPPPQQPQPQPQLHHHPSKDKFSLHQNPNYQVAPSELPPNFALHRTDEFGFRPPQPPPVTKTEAFVADVATPAPSAPAAPAEASKEGAQAGKKRRGGPGGLNKLCGVSPQLQAIVGQPALPRTEIVKQLWAYIRKNNLQDPSNKRKIICNDELRLVFETDCTDMFKMNKLLAKHIITLEPTKQVGQSSKKLKWKGDAPIRGYEACLGIHKGQPTGGSSKFNGDTL
ncbi:hypothetical protein F0562_010025 [Nyssa sinensis]|uniref:DM2 domain-containing protein n=1 Tax=Nyssa sinensis TaxID=561372 RepID=A0A5J5A1F7_9ASTE|nr:hypothetical protein F0562_010025 [Nyssa sinensis]